MSTAEQTATTEIVARQWFERLTSGDGEGALALMADDVEFVNYIPVPGYNTDMNWIGTWRGVDQVRESFRLFLDTVDVKREEVLRVIAQGEHAAGVIHEISTVKATGQDFEIEFVQWLTVRDGRIVRWMSYTDPSEILRAIRGEAG
ncbi:nuclear transport factor 2 family protein [Kutzneria kofuensis]|uniref:SnoaL-like domain-containing protein n=1 Tax=Kutzneria kofuensis TaxID=103725 RepID=A0A7W9NM00_9PSEU|nr:nuclear transport factor 2 family protein [Kutzneria kofuensis]MBB5897006.1 hypothetical protein [Kutzneria kofuensis]